MDFDPSTAVLDSFDPSTAVKEKSFDPVKDIVSSPEDATHRFLGNLTSGLLGAGEAITRFVSPSAANYLEAKGKEVRAYSRAHQNPELDTTAGAGIASALGNVAGLVPSMQIPGRWIPALVGGTQAAAQAYSQHRTQALDMGKSEDEASNKGLKQAGFVAATMPAYLAGGKIASELTASYLPATASAFTRFVTGTAAASTANVATSAGIRKLAGEPIIPEDNASLAGSLAQDFGFGLLHGYGESRLPEAVRNALGQKAAVELSMQKATEQYKAGKISPQDFAFIEFRNKEYMDGLNKFINKNKKLAEVVSKRPQEQLDQYQQELDAIEATPDEHFNETQKTEETTATPVSEPTVLEPTTIPDTNAETAPPTIPETVRVRAKIDPVFKEHADNVYKLSGQEQSKYISDNGLDPADFGLPESVPQPKTEEVTPITPTEEKPPISQPETIVEQPSITPTEVTSPRLSAKMEVFKKATQKITEGWKNAPDIVVVPDSSKIPEEAFPQKDRQAFGTIDGLLGKDGKVYLIGDKVPNIQRAKEIVLHEAKGHYGLKGLFGDDLAGYTNAMKSVWTEFQARPALMDEIAKRADFKSFQDLKTAYSHLDINTPEGRAAMSDELLSRAAEIYQDPAKPRPTWFNHIVAKIKLALQKVMPSMKLTDHDIVSLLSSGQKKILDRADELVEQGSPKSVIGSPNPSAIKKSSEEPINNIDYKRIKELGFTNDFREAGYITLEGKLVDLSGKKEGGPSGTRSYDHREAGGSKGMLQFMNQGNIRLFPESGGIDIIKIPTLKQQDVIKRFIDFHNGKVVMDLADGLGTENDYAYNDPARKASVEFPEGTKANKVLGIIKRFYSGEDIKSGPKFSMTGKKAAPAEFIGNQDMGDGEQVPFFNLTEDIPGHTKDSTVSSDTLIRKGYDAPEGYTGEFKTSKFGEPQASIMKDETAPSPMPSIRGSFKQIKDTAKEIKDFVVEAPKFTEFKKALLNWSALNQQSTWSIREQYNNINKLVPDKAKREAITNWIQAGGDKKTLEQWEAGTKDEKLKKAYKLAQELTPEEIGVANAVKASYDSLLNKAQKYGIQINALDNYVNQIWNKGPMSGFTTTPKRLSDFFRFASKRVYGSFFEGEQAGLKPETKDISNLLGIYTNELNNAINSRRLVEDLSKAKASDGRPLLAPRGGATVVPGFGSDKGVILVFPKMGTEETADYKSLNQPALQGWKWSGQDELGNPIMVKSDLMVHPEAYDHLKNILGKSFLREWWSSPSENPFLQISKGSAKFLVDDLQQIMKQTMLGFLSPFHAVQEGTHAIGHRVNPFTNIPAIDLATDKGQMDASQHGLMLSPDTLSRDMFMDGLGGTTKNLASKFAGKIPGIGPKIQAWSDGFQNWLFESYIPGLKYKTYEHIFDRNKERFSKDIASGKVTEDQVKNLSAQQANAAYGHLNYAEMGRNPSMQHLMQAFLLAPDFLEARIRFTGQAVKPSKTGAEQRAALMTLAATFYISARILNKLLDDDYHWDQPFEVTYKNKTYSMRSVPEDIYKLFKDSRRFIYGRLSPMIGRGTIEGLSGVNYRGEPTELNETLKNMVAGTIPLTLQPMTRQLTQQTKQNPVSPLEQLMGSMGIQVRRYSPISEMYQLSSDWMKKHDEELGIEKRKGVYPVSKYSQLRYALEDGDFDKAAEEISTLKTSEKLNISQIAQGFKTSIFHPFTGSRRTDALFRESLSDKDKKTFDAAVARRMIIWERFAKALREAK